MAKKKVVNNKPETKPEKTEEEKALAKKRSERIQWIVFLTAVVIFFIVNNTGSEPDQGPYPPFYNPDAPRKGNPAPEFILEGVNADSLSLADQKGKVVLLTFWSTWSSPAMNTLKALNGLYESFDKEQVAFIGVSLDDAFRGIDAKQAVKPTIEDFGITFPVLHGTKKTAEDYGKIKSFPVTFIIDQEGKVAARFAQASQLNVYAGNIAYLLQPEK